jgi:predicted nucleic acid-binding protein
MRINSVVMDASPLVCMMKAGIIEILPALFKNIVVPQAVNSEIMVKERSDPKGQVLASYQRIKLVEDIPIAPQVASWDLGQGESQVISLAVEHPDYWAVIDDREARCCATALRSHHTRTLGIIVLAKKRGIIPSICGHLERLKEVGLWISDEIVDQVCRRSEE